MNLRRIFQNEVFWLPVCQLPMVRFMAFFLTFKPNYNVVLMHRKIVGTLNVNVM